MRTSESAAGSTGPCVDQATLFSTPKMPARFAWWGVIRRFESRCRRR